LLINQSRTFPSSVISPENAKEIINWICVLCLVHLLSQNLVRAYSNLLSMLNFLCILKIMLVYSKIRFLYINWLIWVYQKCFEYTLKIWVYLKIWGHSKQILRKQMD
jgi:hypothetical protein